MTHDILDDVLSVTGVRGVLGARFDAGSDWAWNAAKVDGAALHAVTHGSAWFTVAGGEPFELHGGDVLLLPHGTEHTLGSDPVKRASSVYESLGSGIGRIGSGATRSRILCAHYEYDTPPFASLPDVVVLRGAEELEDTIRLFGRELTNPQPATSRLLSSAVDILLVQILRAWLPQQPSWLGALRDPVVGTAVRRMHAEPAREWTTSVLAQEAAVSRATLTRRFASVLGEAPAAYLTRWRMDVAASRLRDGDESLEQVAAAVGYTSVYAFSRAFRRARGVPPGRYRSLRQISSSSSVRPVSANPSRS